MKYIETYILHFTQVHIRNIAKSKELPKPKTPTELNDYRNSRRSTTKCPNEEWGTNVEWEQVWDVFSPNTKKPS